MEADFGYDCANDAKDRSYSPGRAMEGMVFCRLAPFGGDSETRNLVACRGGVHGVHSPCSPRSRS